MTDNINKRKDKSSFEDVNKRNDKWSEIAEERQRLAGIKTIEEAHLEQRLRQKEEVSEKFRKKHTELEAKIYGYTDTDLLYQDMPAIKAGTIKPKPHLFKSQEAYIKARDISLPNVAAYYGRIEKEKEQISEQLERRRISQEEIAQGRFESTVRKEVRDLPVRAGLLSRRPNVATGAFLDISKDSFKDYAGNVEELREKQRRISSHLLEAAQNYGTPEGQAGYKGISKQADINAAELGRAIALEREQRRRGFDTESQLRKAESLVEREGTRKEGKRIQEDAAKGKYGSLAEELSKLETVGDSLTNALNKLKKEVEETGKATEETKKNLNKQSEAYEKQAKVIKEVERSGGQKLNNISNVLGIATAAIDVARYGTVTSEIQQRQVRASVAGIVNQEYDDYMSAARGDMSAFRRLSTDLYGRSKKDFDEFKTREGLWTTGDTAAQAMDAGIRGYASYSNASIAGTLTGSAIAKAGNEAAPAIAQSLKTGIGGLKGIPQTMAAVQGQAALREVEDAAYNIFDKNNQLFRNFSTNMYENIQGFGGKAGSAAFSAFADKKTMAGFANYGINPNQMAQMMGQAGQQMGGAFTGTGASEQVRNITRAAEVGQSRIMSAQQYISGGAQLAQTGGGFKQLEEVMASAIARGMGNAKNINDMVAAISSMASRRMSESGVNVTTGATQLMTRGTAALASVIPGAENELVRQTRAALDIQAINTKTTGLGMDFPSAVGFASISQNFKDVSAFGRRNIKKLKIEDITEMESLLAKKDTSKLIGLARTLGVSETVVDEKGNLKADVSESFKKMREGKTDEIISTLAGTRGEKGENIPNELRDWIKSKGKTKMSEATRAATVALIGSSPETLQSLEEAVGKKALRKANLDKLSGAAAAGAKLESAAAGAELKATTTGMENFGKNIDEALNKFATRFSEVMKDLKPGDLQTKGARAAEQMNLDVSIFNSAVSTFDATVKRLEKAVELMPVASKTLSTATDMVTKGALGGNKSLSTEELHKKSQQMIGKPKW